MLSELPLEEGYSLTRQVIQDEIVLYLDFKCPHNIQKSFKIKVESIIFGTNTKILNDWESTIYCETFIFKNGKMRKKVDYALISFESEDYQLAEKITKSFIRESFDGQPIMDFLESF